MAAESQARAYRFFQLDRSDHVVTVFFDKPPMNTLERELYPELHAVCDQLDDDAEARAVVFASRIPGVFVAGADIKEMTTYHFEERWIDDKIATVNCALNRVEDLRAPTVVAIEGHALGGGCEFSLCCDFRFMARGKPLIGLPEIRLGLIPGGGGCYRLPRLVGYGKALEMILTGARLGADEAQSIGLITRACDAEKTLAQAQEFAATLAAQAPIAAARAKQAVRDAWGKARDQASELEKKRCLEAVMTDDFREGITAFVQKRKPDWKGK